MNETLYEWISRVILRQPRKPLIETKPEFGSFEPSYIFSPYRVALSCPPEPGLDDGIPDTPEPDLAPE